VGAMLHLPKGPPEVPHAPTGFALAGLEGSVGLRRPCSTPGDGLAEGGHAESLALSQPFASRWQQALRHTNQSTAYMRGRKRSKRRFSRCCGAMKAPAD